MPKGRLVATAGIRLTVMFVVVFGVLVPSVA